MASGVPPALPVPSHARGEMQQVVGCTLAHGVWDWSRVPATPGVVSTDGVLGGLCSHMEGG